MRTSPPDHQSSLDVTHLSTALQTAAAAAEQFTARFLDTTRPLKKAYRESWEVDIRLNLSGVLK